MACDGSFALVHNGHSFNGQLAKQLKQEGHHIKGETDSEVLCHLVERLYSEHGDMASAFWYLDEYGFSGAILVLMRDGRIFGYRDETYPICIARHNREVYLASTVKAIESLVGHSVKAWEPKPWQTVEVNKGKVYVYKPKHVEKPKVTVETGFPWYGNFFWNNLNHNLRGGEYV
jgi:glutamine phosphoribosylpyrophosphate amidotransferase